MCCSSFVHHIARMARLQPPPEGLIAILTPANLHGRARVRIRLPVERLDGPEVSVNELAHAMGAAFSQCSQRLSLLASG